jgi:Tol biopolymer transport system component
MPARRPLGLLVRVSLLGLVWSIAATQSVGAAAVWSAPVNLGPSINTSADEFHFSISRDELTTFFAADRSGGLGGHDIWYAQRPNRNSGWGSAHDLGPSINTHFDEAGPELSPDGHWLFFSSAGKPAGMKGFGGNDLWAAHREDTADPAQFGSEAPINLGPGVNTQDSDVDATLFQDPQIGITMYFASDRAPDCLNKQASGDCLDIYRSTLQPDSSGQSASCSLSSLGQGCYFEPAVRVPELSSPLRDAHPTVSRDGLEMFLASTRAGTLGGLDLWVSTRSTTSDNWAAPVNLGPGVNSQHNERAPFLSADGQTLYFTSDRPGGFGLNDFYMTQRGS